MKTFLALFVFFSTLIYAENISQEKLISNYLYNFSLHTTWPDGIKNKKFEVYLLSSNKKLSSVFKNLIKGQKLHGKEIRITQSSSTSIPYSANVVFIDTKHLKEYKKVYEQLDSRPVLLVSNAYDNKRLVMINLTHEKDKNVHFEINKANILNQRLSINPKIILLGGTELDVAKLYKSAKVSLLEKEKELESQFKKSKQLKIEISQYKNTNTILQHQFLLLSGDVVKLEDSIKDLNKKVLNSKQEFKLQLNKQKEILEREKLSTKQIRDDYSKANIQLDEMSSKLGFQKEKLSTKEKEVKDKETRLSSLTQKVQQKSIEFQRLQENLASQDVQIQNQGETIDTQKHLILIFAFAALIFLMLVFIIFKTLRREHKTNDALLSTQEALEEQVQKTEKANQSKTKFLAHMSHELRTPLNAVLGYSQLLQKDSNMSNENQKTLATINRSGEHLLALINDVLEVSKIETGNIALDPVPFDLYQFLDDIYSMFAERLSGEGLNLELIKDVGLPQYILADINKVRQIFINILGNSIKFTSVGGITIRVGYDLQRSSLLVEIEDTGEGIDKKEIDKLFQPFKQTITGKLGGGGAGLGLSIVQEYIQLMGGKVEVKSKPAFGTIFYLQIPYEEAEYSEIHTQSFKTVKSLKEEDKGIEVLIADDNKVNNNLLADVLTRVGFHVTAMENGLEALRVFKQDHHKLVLLDIEMPVMNGHQTVKEIKALAFGHSTPVIAVTASVFGIDHKKAMQSGFDALVRKPFKDYELFEEIGKALNLEYIYEEEKGIEKVESVTLENLDKDFKDELFKAVSRMRVTEINSLISKIEKSFPKEAQYLNKLSQKFDYETLKNLLKK